MKQIVYEMIKHTEVFIKETMSRVYFKVLLGVGENRVNKISEMLVSAEIKWEIHYAIPYVVFNFCACLNFS